jgi:hypothetical protein
MSEAMEKAASEEALKRFLEFPPWLAPRPFSPYQPRVIAPIAEAEAREMELEKKREREQERKRESEAERKRLARLARKREQKRLKWKTDPKYRQAATDRKAKLKAAAAHALAVRLEMAPIRRKEARKKFWKARA